jgi:hypothetical protein
MNNREIHWNEPFQLVTLLDMLQHNAARFLGLMSSIANFERALETSGSDTPGETIVGGGEVVEVLTVLLSDMESHCLSLELRLSVQKIKRIKNTLGTSTLLDAAEMLRSLHERIIDELSSRTFLSIPSLRAELFDNPTPFGDAVASRFPDASYDIGEAAKCYALNRHTGAVFHLMRVQGARRKAALPINAGMAGNLWSDGRICGQLKGPCYPAAFV